MLRWVAGALAVLAGCGGAAYYYLREDPLRAELDRRWPPVAADQQRQAATDSAASALKALVTPNVAAGVDIATIRQIAFEELKSRGVTRLDLATDRQLLRMTADFGVTLTPDILPVNSDKRPLIATLVPEVVGEVELSLTAAISVSNSPRRALLVNLLPVVSRIRIDKLTLKGSYDVGTAADAIAFLLNRYADNLSGALSASPVMNVTLPTTFRGGFDPSGPIKIDLKGAPGLKLSIASRPLQSPFGLAAGAWLIDADKVIAIAELAPPDKLPARGDPAIASFEEVKGRIRKALEDGLGIADPPSGLWAAFGKALIAHGLDSTFAQAQPCIEGSVPIPTETFHAKIPTLDASGIDCTPTRDCTPTKDCGGYQWYQAPDKLRCETEKSAAKLDCERLKSQEKGQCEFEKSGQKIACEAGKGLIDGLHRTGNIGNVDGSVSGTGSLRVCFQDVHSGTALEKLELTIAASGSATLDTHFKFVPLDVAGHVLCPLEWTADKTITTSVPSQSIGANVSLARATDTSALTYRGSLDELPVNLRFQPSPLSLVLQNVNFVLACPVASGLINGLTLGLAPFLPEFLKDFTYKLNPSRSR